MATRGSGTQSIGSAPPQLVWTVVRGDSASFRCYVTDDDKQALEIAQWTLKMDIKRGGTLVSTHTPSVTSVDGPGEFTVALLPSESEILETEDLFDIQLTNGVTGQVWTVAQGSMSIVEDVTD